MFYLSIQAIYGHKIFIIMYISINIALVILVSINIIMIRLMKCKNYMH